jgi:tetratricopeptide (TPR) repeat protein
MRPQRARPAQQNTHVAGTWWAFPLAATALVLLTGLAFGPSLGNEFVNLDDYTNIVENREAQGLGWPQVVRAFTAPRLGVYQPLPSLLLSVQWAAAGPRPAAYHATSLALHALNAVVLLALSVTLVKRLMPSLETDRAVLACFPAVVLYAVHPQRVEAVCFATAQLYLPSALFLMLAVLAYLKANAEGPPSWKGLAATFGLGALAMSCMPGAVTLPAVLLIVDVAVLRRFGPGRWTGPEARRALIEKASLALVSMAFMGAAYWAKSRDSMLIAPALDGPFERLAMLTYGIYFYLSHVVVPIDFAAYYPRPKDGDFRSWPYPLVMLGMLAAGVAVVIGRRRWPWLVAALACYVTLLLPHLGLLRVSEAIAADRYAYAAGLVPALLMAVGLCHWLGTRPLKSPALIWVGAGGLAATLVLIGVSRDVVGQWHDSETLWRRALARTPWSSYCRWGLGSALALQGRHDEAIVEFRETLGVRPNWPKVWVSLGASQSALKRFDEAAVSYREALRLHPGMADALFHLGVALTVLDRTDEAVQAYRRLIELRPNFATAHEHLGMLLMKRGKLGEAIEEFERAGALDPDAAGAYGSLGAALAMKGLPERAVASYRRAMELRPDQTATRLNLGMALAQMGRLDEAIAELSQVVRDGPANVQARVALGATLAQMGRLNEAIAEFSEVLRMDPQNQQARSLMSMAVQQRGRAVR